MTLVARVVLLLLVMSAGCVASNLVGEMMPATGPADASGADADEAAADGALIAAEDGGSPDARGGAGGIAGAMGQAGATGAGGALPASFDIRLAPETGENAMIWLIGVDPQPPRTDGTSFVIGTTTFDGVPVIRRGLMRFYLPFAMQASQVARAELSLFHDPDFVAHTTGTRWQLARAAGAWSTADVTWPTQPPQTDAFEPAAPNTATTDYKLDVTAIVRAAIAAGESPAFALRLIDENTIGQKLTFCSRDHDKVACRPLLHVDVQPVAP